MPYSVNEKGNTYEKQNLYCYYLCFQHCICRQFRFSYQALLRLCKAELYDNLIEAVETLPDESSEPMNYSEEKTFIPEYQELYLQNNDMVGWIKVEDTKINYPVMQSKDNPNFYLKHGFDKAYTDYGCPYVQENCDMELPSDNIIIYGHHMNDGSMFAGLMKFKDKSFWEKHKTVSFDTLTGKQTYEVIAVFKTVVYTDSPDSFKYYQFVNAETAEDFTAYVESARNCRFTIPRNR